MKTHCIQLKCLFVGEEPEIPLIDSLTEIDKYIFVDNISGCIDTYCGYTKKNISDPYGVADKVAVVLVLLNVSCMPIH